jgi:predicted dehydrogenase
MESDVNRRDALKLGAGVGAGVVLPALAQGQETEDDIESADPRLKPIPRVRVGMVGIGGRGFHLLRLLLGQQHVEVKAVCDLLEDRCTLAQKATVSAGQQRPDAYFPNERAFEKLCERDDLDLIVTATPWRWHVPVCVAAMKNGHHAATEVPAAVTLDECWQMVETAEQTGRHCVMLENCCYGRTEMMVLNMVRQGLLGELIHGEAGYLHELREDRELLGPNQEVNWRLEHMIHRDGNLYPTHGLGPVAQCMNINRGDQFDYLVSMSSVSRGLNVHYASRFGAKHPLATRKYKLGDVNTTMIRTKLGRTITVGHDTQLPRPYTRINMVQGTLGIVQGYPDQIALESNAHGHSWEPIDKFQSKYEHPLWKKLIKEAQGKGHGGMDFMEIHRLIECLITGTEPDMDVYDAAAWSAISDLSERSVAKRSKTIDVPDFTRGRWKKNRPLGIIGG